MYGFWTFLFEQLNKVLKSYKSNNHGNRELKASFFCEFHCTVHVSQIVSHGIYLWHLFTFLIVDYSWVKPILPTIPWNMLLQHTWSMPAWTSVVLWELWLKNLTKQTSIVSVQLHSIPIDHSTYFQPRWSFSSSRSCSSDTLWVVCVNVYQDHQSPPSTLPYSEVTSVHCPSPDYQQHHPPVIMLGSSLCGGPFQTLCGLTLCAESKKLSDWGWHRRHLILWWTYPHSIFQWESGCWAT